MRTRNQPHGTTQLAENGAAEIGWVEYRVMRSAHRPILQFKSGWPAEKIARCFA